MTSIQFKKLGQPAQIKNYALLQNHWIELQKKFQSLEVAFFQSPLREEIHQLHEIKKTVAIAESNGIQNLVILGIGGSSLGAKACLDALGPKKNHVYFLESPDTKAAQSLLKSLNPDQTLIAAMTKSGKTFETLSLFLDCLAWLTPKRWQKNLIIVTDPTAGELRDFANKKNIKSLPIHPGLGGRYSFFSPIGLLPAEWSGFKTSYILEGAQSLCEDLIQNPMQSTLAEWTDEILTLENQNSLHVFFSYIQKTQFLGAWWAQLWAESLGKNQRGFLPLALQGPQDQHSILQLLMEGPWVPFVQILYSKTEIQNRTLIDLELNENLKILSSCSGTELVEIEAKSIAESLHSRGSTVWTLEIDNEFNERSFGWLLMFYMCLTAWTGRCMNINPFDQPGVEAGKKLILEELKNKKSI